MPFGHNPQHHTETDRQADNIIMPVKWNKPSCIPIGCLIRLSLWWPAVVSVLCISRVWTLKHITHKSLQKWTTVRKRNVKRLTLF